MTLLSKISTPEEAKLGLHAIAMMRRHRSQNQQHTPFNKDVVWTFLRVRWSHAVLSGLPLLSAHDMHLCMQACVRVQAFDTMLEAFQRNHELGLGELSLRLYSSSLVELIKAEQLDLATRWAVLPCQSLCVALVMPAGMRLAAWLAAYLHPMCCRVFETMPRNGVKPSRKVGLLLSRAFQAQQQPEVAEAFREEFEMNKIRLS